MNYDPHLFTYQFNPAATPKGTLAISADILTLWKGKYLFGVSTDTGFLKRKVIRYHPVIDYFLVV
ncbi:hypothetical protein NECAME_10057 [Necator americanus]|uniref:Uncharacterized protein n=1 Tax=Necator americanus TaxID=51031 RepID=W2TAJ5_NECAM|nr:hypothetical protein NECAME_10057 [Necator americanus]ETN79055.1 hypothetical protein NECAME_10057 [Necator americanus]